MTTHHNVHVVAETDSTGWKVQPGRRTLSQHRTQMGAVKAATPEARRDRVELVTDGRDGRIRSKDSYGNEGSTRDTEH